MRNRLRRRLLLAGVFVAAVSVLLLTNAGRVAVLRSHFRLEQAWTEHWPFAQGKYAPYRLRPLVNKLGPVRVEVEPGMFFLLDPRDWLPRAILTSGDWQPEVWHSLEPRLPQGGVFLDVGAHIGYFSVKAARQLGNTGKVIAFEPNPEILKLLHQNVRASNAANVVIDEIACTDREQMVTLYATSDISSAVSSLAQDNVKSEVSPHPITVRGRPIDDVVRELGLTRVDAIKIDVEGAETLVLRGAKDTLKRFGPYLILEIAPDLLAGFHTKPEDVFQLLRKAGYTQGKPLSRGSEDWEWTRQ